LDGGCFCVESEGEKEREDGKENPYHLRQG